MLLRNSGLVSPVVVGPRGCALSVSSRSLGSTLSSTNGNDVHFFSDEKKKKEHSNYSLLTFYKVLVMCSR